MEVLLVLGAAFLAFSNGANDNFKGFATVWGSGTLSYRRALVLATVTTALGSIASVALAHTLVQHFSGRGLVPADVAGSSEFILSVGVGAASTVLLATRIGIPISTTHALLGGLVGAGLAHGGGTVNFSQLTGTFLLPLLVSPVAAAVLGLAVHRIVRLRRAEHDCACVIAPGQAVDAGAHGAAVARHMEPPRMLVAGDAECDRLAAPVVRVRISAMLDRVHTLSAASICFARGVNDTPKLVAVLLAANVFGVHISALAIAVVMAVGGLLFSRRVAQTMSQRMALMDHAQGLSANLISAGLILVASKFGLPVSTTHVSVGSIAGVGAGARSLDGSTLRKILLSWLATLPVAALFAAALAASL